MKAAEYITKQGGFVIRMGSTAKTAFHTMNPKIIDYATKYRSDFGDVFLPATCKFFLGNTSGISLISTIFHVPSAGTNYIPFHTPYRHDDLFILKRLWSTALQRHLTFQEMLDFDSKTQNPFVYVEKRCREANLIIQENTPEDILDLAREMNERINETFREAKSDQQLQKRFRSLLQPHHHLYASQATISTSFLRKNKQLLLMK